MGYRFSLVGFTRPLMRPLRKELIMSTDQNMLALQGAMKLREICNRIVAELRAAADGDEVQLITIDSVETMFNTQSDLIATLLVHQMEYDDFVQEAITMLK